VIIDVLPNQYEALALKHSFKPWQTGLLGNMLSSSKKEKCINVNMGRSAGHTYFSRVVASSEFPSRTKVYVSRKQAFSEYSSLLFDKNKVHEPIELLDSCSKYSGSPVAFVLIDMNGQSAQKFNKELNEILSSIPLQARVVILQAYFLNF